MRFWWWLLLLPTVAMAKPDQWPRRYNAGVTAYRTNDFAQAATAFENATAAQDRTLEQRALYNLGNTDYRLGQAQPQQAQQLWQRAIKSYESALALDPNDPDAKFNHEFVKKKLEELKKQQQQQQQQNQNQKNQQDQKQKQQDNHQQQQSQGKQSEQQQQQQKQDQQEPNKQPAQQSQEQQQQDKRQQDQQRNQQDQPDKPSRAEQPPQENGSQPQDMDKMQATEMLDNLREDERNWNFFPEMQMKDLKDSGPPAKDW
jgi:Ca-activated chloride channel family protein